MRRLANFSLLSVPLLFAISGLSGVQANVQGIPIFPPGVQEEQSAISLHFRGHDSHRLSPPHLDVADDFHNALSGADSRRSPMLTSFRHNVISGSLALFPFTVPSICSQVNTSKTHPKTPPFTRDGQTREGNKFFNYSSETLMDSSCLLDIPLYPGRNRSHPAAALARSQQSKIATDKKAVLRSTSGPKSLVEMRVYYTANTFTPGGGRAPVQLVNNRGLAGWEWPPKLEGTIVDYWQRRVLVDLWGGNSACRLLNNQVIWFIGERSDLDTGLNFTDQAVFDTFPQILLAGADPSKVKIDVKVLTLKDSQNGSSNRLWANGTDLLNNYLDFEVAGGLVGPGCYMCAKNEGWMDWWFAYNLTGDVHQIYYMDRLDSSTPSLQTAQSTILEAALDVMEAAAEGDIIIILGLTPPRVLSAESGKRFDELATSKRLFVAILAAASGGPVFGPDRFLWRIWRERLIQSGVSLSTYFSTITPYATDVWKKFIDLAIIQCNRRRANEPLQNSTDPTPSDIVANVGPENTLWLEVYYDGSAFPNHDVTLLSFVRESVGNFAQDFEAAGGNLRLEIMAPNVTSCYSPDNVLSNFTFWMEQTKYTTTRVLRTALHSYSYSVTSNLGDLGLNWTDKVFNEVMGVPLIDDNPPAPWVTECMLILYNPNEPVMRNRWSATDIQENDKKVAVYATQYEIGNIKATGWTDIGTDKSDFPDIEFVLLSAHADDQGLPALANAYHWEKEIFPQKRQHKRLVHPRGLDFNSQFLRALHHATSHTEGVLFDGMRRFHPNPKAPIVSKRNRHYAWVVDRTGIDANALKCLRRDLEHERDWLRDSVGTPLFQLVLWDGAHETWSSSVESPSGLDWQEISLIDAKCVHGFTMIDAVRSASGDNTSTTEEWLYGAYADYPEDYNVSLRGSLPLWNIIRQLADHLAFDDYEFDSAFIAVYTNSLPADEPTVDLTRPYDSSSWTSIAMKVPIPIVIMLPILTSSDLSSEHNVALRNAWERYLWDRPPLDALLRVDFYAPSGYRMWHTLGQRLVYAKLWMSRAVEEKLSREITWRTVFDTCDRELDLVVDTGAWLRGGRNEHQASIMHLVRRALMASQVAGVGLRVHTFSRPNADESSLDCILDDRVFTNAHEFEWAVMANPQVFEGKWWWRKFGSQPFNFTAEKAIAEATSRTSSFPDRLGKCFALSAGELEAHFPAATGTDTPIRVTAVRALGLPDETLSFSQDFVDSAKTRLLRLVLDAPLLSPEAADSKLPNSLDRWTAYLKNNFNPTDDSGYFSVNQGTSSQSELSQHVVTDLITRCRKGEFDGIDSGLGQQLGRCQFNSEKRRLSRLNIVFDISSERSVRTDLNNIATCIGAQIEKDTSLADLPVSWGIGTDDGEIETKQDGIPGSRVDTSTDFPLVGNQCGLRSDLRWSQKFGDGTRDWVYRQNYTTRSDFPDDNGNGLKLALKVLRESALAAYHAWTVIVTGEIPASLSELETVELVEYLRTQQRAVLFAVPYLDTTTGKSRIGAWKETLWDLGLDAGVFLIPVNPSGTRAWKAISLGAWQQCQFQSTSWGIRDQNTNTDQLVKLCSYRNLDIGAGFDLASFPAQINFVNSQLEILRHQYHKASGFANVSLARWGWYDVSAGGRCLEFHGHDVADAAGDYAMASGLTTDPLTTYLNFSELRVNKLEDELAVAEGLHNTNIAKAPPSYAPKCVPGLTTSRSAYWADDTGHGETLRIEVIISNDKPQDVAMRLFRELQNRKGAAIIIMSTALSSDYQYPGYHLSQLWAPGLDQSTAVTWANMTTSGSNFLGALKDALSVVCRHQIFDDKDSVCSTKKTCAACATRSICSWCLRPDYTNGCTLSEWCLPMFVNDICDNPSWMAQWEAASGTIAGPLTSSSFVGAFFVTVFGWSVLKDWPVL